jgi:hypothetical protein
VAKKSRRVRRLQTRPAARLSPSQMVQPAPGEPRAAAAAAAPAEPQQTDLRREYHYVLKDLGRIGIIAAAMLAVLVVLALVLV